MSPLGYERRFRPVSEHDRSTPESRPSSGNVRFLGVEARSTSDSRRRWARPAKTGNDPKRPCRDKVRPHSKSQARTSQKSPKL